MAKSEEAGVAVAGADDPVLDRDDGEGDAPADGEGGAEVEAGEPRARITCTIRQQYRNMRYWLEADMTPVELVREACRKVGIEPFSMPIRGGTDGSRLTEMGVPTPNIFTGMQMIHGPLEWISVQDMAAATEVCIALAGLAAKAK